MDSKSHRLLFISLTFLLEYHPYSTARPASGRCISAATALRAAVQHHPQAEPVGERDAVPDAARVFPIEVRLDAPRAVL